MTYVSSPGRSGEGRGASRSTEVPATTGDPGPSTGRAVRCGVVLAAVGWLGIPFSLSAEAATGTALHRGSVTAPALSLQEASPRSRPNVDSARSELEIGRYWHAARHLRGSDEGPDSLTPGERLLLARAEAGYEAWGRVVETLSDAEWLEEEAGGAGLRLLGRALDEEGEALEAAEVYARYLGSPAGRTAPDRIAVLVRRAMLLGRADSTGAAIRLLAGARGDGPTDGVIVSWAALDLAEALAIAGDTAGVRGALELVDDAEAASWAWELPASAALSAGDTTRALALYGGSASSPAASRRARSHLVTGEVHLARGDTTAAVVAFRSVIESGDRGGEAVRAARRLSELASQLGEHAIDVATLLEGSGDARAALRAYDEYLSRVPVEEVSERVLLSRARLMSRVAGRQDEAVEAFRSLSTSETEAIGAAALESWADLRRSQGRAGDVATLRRWLLERYPASDQAADVVFFRGDAAQDRLEMDAALAAYGRLQTMAPDLDQAGLARMRTAMIHLERGDSAAALKTFESYLEDYPSGRRWAEATYWAGTLSIRSGEEERGRTLLRSIGARDPVSYYAVLASESLGEPFALPVGPSVTSAPPPPWARGELLLIDALEEAGLARGRAHRVRGVTERALADSASVALRVAEELILRGLTIEGINIGWELRRGGVAWSRELLEVVYPLPNREMILRAAHERGLDPLLLAAIIRQESAFDPDVTSAAGAVGLMQVMPETGRQLAASLGPADFDRRSLTTPEINLHLGTSYLVELDERYGGDLPLVLSAYNAGPSRANRWRGFPEADDPLRFTERIPFRETRDYVKLIRRNIAIYDALYGPLEAP